MYNRSYTRLYGFQFKINAIDSNWLVVKVAERTLNEVLVLIIIPDIKSFRLVAFGNLTSAMVPMDDDLEGALFAFARSALLT